MYIQVSIKLLIKYAIGMPIKATVSLRVGSIDI